MKMVVAIIRSERARILKQRLGEIGITAMTIADITAWSQHRKITLQRRGIPVSYDLVHMAKMELFVPDDQLDQVISTIKDNVRTGQPGDGVIAVSDLEQLINISTLKEQEDALRKA